MSVRRVARVKVTSRGSEPSTSEAICRVGGAYALFVDSDQQTGAAVFLNLRVADGIELADSGEAREHLVEVLDVDRFADQWL